MEPSRAEKGEFDKRKNLEMSMLACCFSEIPNTLEFIKTKPAEAAFCVEVTR